MKRTIITLNVVFAALVLTILLMSPRAQSFNSSAAIAAPAPMAAAVPDRCPNIHSAQDGLRSAEQELREGRHDFCGHKVEAMKAVHEAIVQLHLAEGCAKCR